MFILASVLFMGCLKTEDEIPINSCKKLIGETKIMTLGASRVQGARPFFESYRYELWKDLIDGNWSFDFIGTQKDEGLYEDYKSYCFDIDHQGKSGWTSKQINDNIEVWLEQTETPDIVLFSSPGGNDAIQGVSIEEILPNINAIIDKIQANNPNATILIEQMAPPKSTFLTLDLKETFEQMKGIIEKIVVEKSTDGSKVILVDMATGFTDDYLADNLHYNAAGATFIATRYYDKLVPLLEK